jgi:hypothetical protein
LRSDGDKRKTEENSRKNRDSVNEQSLQGD